MNTFTLDLERGSQTVQYTTGKTEYGVPYIDYKYDRAGVRTLKPCTVIEDDDIQSYIIGCILRDERAQALSPIVTNQKGESNGIRSINSICWCVYILK